MQILSCNFLNRNNHKHLQLGQFFSSFLRQNHMHTKNSAFQKEKVHNVFVFALIFYGFCTFMHLKQFVIIMSSVKFCESRSGKVRPNFMHRIQLYVSPFKNKWYWICPKCIPFSIYKTKRINIQCIRFIRKSFDTCLDSDEFIWYSWNHEYAMIVMLYETRKSLKKWFSKCWYFLCKTKNR